MKKGVESDTVACFAESIKLVLEVCYRSGSDDIEHEPTCRPVLSLPKEMLVSGKTPLRVRKSECAEKNEYVVFELFVFSITLRVSLISLHSARIPLLECYTRTNRYDEGSKRENG